MLPRPVLPALVSGLALLLVTATPSSVGAAADGLRFVGAAPAPGLVGATYTPELDGAYDDPARPVVLTTAGGCSADGATIRFTAPGDCTITADQAGDGADQAPQQAEQTVVVRRDRTLTFDAGQPTEVRVGSPTQVTASPDPALGEGEQVVYGGGTPDVCEVTADGTVRALRSGTCTVTASTPASGEHVAASTTLPLTVRRGARTVAFEPASPTRGDVGQTLAVTATSSPGSPVAYDTTDPTACTVTAEGRVTLRAAGTCTVVASVAQDDSYESARAELAVQVARAATTSTLTAYADRVVVRVTGGLAPGGTVTARGAGQPVTRPLGADGTATLPITAPLTSEQTFTASYSGDANHRTASTTYTRTPPDLRLRLDDAPPRTGWYRGPVRVDWVCAPGSSPVRAPRGYTLFEDGRDWEVRATCRAEDGGQVVRGRGSIDIDGTPPVVTPQRTGRAPYPASTKPVRCRATDATSGVATCRTTYGAVRRQGGQWVRPWTATATDGAGNRAQRRGTFPVRR